MEKSTESRCLGARLTLGLLGLIFVAGAYAQRQPDTIEQAGPDAGRLVGAARELGQRVYLAQAQQRGSAPLDNAQLMQAIWNSIESLSSCTHVYTRGETVDYSEFKLRITEVDCIAQGRVSIRSAIDLAIKLAQEDRTTYGHPARYEVIRQTEGAFSCATKFLSSTTETVIDPNCPKCPAVDRRDGYRVVGTQPYYEPACAKGYQEGLKALVSWRPPAGAVVPPNRPQRIVKRQFPAGAANNNCGSALYEATNKCTGYGYTNCKPVGAPSFGQRPETNPGPIFTNPTTVPMCYVIVEGERVVLDEDAD